MSELTTRPPSQADRATWKRYWESQGQPWRSEPEIDATRQALLIAHRGEESTGGASLRDLTLIRADIEWLLATHQSGGYTGPVDWSDPAQHRRAGLDLRGVRLAHANLAFLPLARADLSEAQVEGANLNQAHLEDANLRRIHLEKALLNEAHLESANLYQAHLEGASLYVAHLEGAYLGQAWLAGASLRRAFFDDGTSFNDAILWDEHHIAPALADIRWGDANLATIDWAQIQRIGDETDARNPLDRTGKPKTRVQWINNYRRAVRAQRQLAVVLRAQGMHEEADRFAYRAQICQRRLLRLQGKLGAAAWSGFLDLLAGYGYRPQRSFIAYLLVIVTFACAYFFLAPHSGVALSPLGSFVFSMTSFHGRGFFPGVAPITLDAPLTVLAAFEAFIGLIIEVSFIATFTQRFFAR